MDLKKAGGVWVAKIKLDLQIPVLVVLLVFYPLMITPYLIPHWAAFIALGLLALFVICKEKLFFYNRCFLPLGLFLLLVFISALFSSHKQEAWLGDPGYLTGFIAYFFFAVLFVLAYAAALRDPSALEKTLDLWLWSAALIAFIGLLQYFGLNLLPIRGEDIFESVKSSSTIFNINDLGTFLAMVFPFAARRFLQRPGFPVVLILGLIYGALLTTFTRGAWLGVAGGIILIV